MAKLGPENGSAPRRPSVTSRGLSKKVVSKSTRRSASAAKSQSDTSQPWRCGNPECTNVTHTSLPRHQTGRKAVSDYFGRNKNSTKDIPPDVWNWLCRICYQQGRYKATARVGAQPQDEAIWSLKLLRDQIERFKIWRPEADFNIQLQAGAEQRYSDYCVALERLGGDRAAAEDSVTTAARQSKKKGQLVRDRRQTLSMSHAKYIKETFAGSNKSYSDIERVVDWMQAEVDRGGLCHLAPIEFIIQDKRDDEPCTDPLENSARSLAQFHGGGSPSQNRGKIELFGTASSASDNPSSAMTHIAKDAPIVTQSKASVGKFRPLTEYPETRDPLSSIPLYQPPAPIKTTSPPDKDTGVAPEGLASGPSSFALYTQPRTKQEKDAKVYTLSQILNFEP